MSLRKFLWCLSLSVFVAGLGYRFAGPLGLSRPHAQAGRAFVGDVLGRAHRADERLVSRPVGRNASFWYLTAADSAVIIDLLAGTPFVSRNRAGHTGELVRGGAAVLLNADLSLESRRPPSETDAPGGEAGGASIYR